MGIEQRMLRIIFETFSLLKNSANFIYSAMHLRCSSEDKRGTVLEVSWRRGLPQAVHVILQSGDSNTILYEVFDFSYELYNCLLCS